MDCLRSRPALLLLALWLVLCGWGCAHQREVVYPPGSDPAVQVPAVPQANAKPAGRTDSRGALRGPRVEILH
jgi:hypothetical protein